MCERKVIGIPLLFFAFILLTTCQLQLNKAGNGFTLRVLIPGNADGTKSTPTLASNAKDLSGGTSVTVTIITQTGSTWASSGLISIGGKTSVDYSVVLPPPGVYQVSAQLLDGSGNVVSQASTTFTVPSQTNLVVLTMTPAAPLGGGIQLAWSANISGPFTAITNGGATPGAYTNVYSDSTWPEIDYYQITNTSSTESLGVGPVTVTNNTGSVFSVNVPPTSPVPPNGTEIFEVQAVYEGGNTYTETVTLKTTSTNPPDQTFTFTVTDFQS